jgi:hypothetical protein
MSSLLEMVSTIMYSKPTDWTFMSRNEEKENL